MKNTINYYYNLNPNKIKQIFHDYYFYINNELYYFTIYKRKINDINAIYTLNQNMLKMNILVHEIINNRTNTIITYINQIPYILMKISINVNKLINLSEISYLSNRYINYEKELMRDNWANLWTERIDYLEYFLSQNSSKYPILADSFPYFTGLAENAIRYLNQELKYYSMEKSDIGVISHNIINENDTVYSLYDPNNIIIDHKARDLGEYIKNSFFKDNYQIFDELDIYFHYNYFSIYGFHLLIARILYPSFYFELFDRIINQEKKEADVLKITSRTSDYEKYLKDIFSYLNKYYKIKEINWIKKREPY